MDTLTPIQLTPNFQLTEFACPCCGTVHAEMPDELIQMCQIVRNILGVPLMIHWQDGGAYRCERLMAQMIAQGKTKPTSQHHQGRAVDCHHEGMETRQDRERLARLFLQNGASYVCIYPWGVHADVRPLGGRSPIQERRDI